MFINTPIGDIRVFVDQDRVSEILLPGWQSEITPNSDQVSDYAHKVEEAFYEYFFSKDKLQAKKAHKELVKICLPGNGNSVHGVAPFHSQIYRSLINDIPSGSTVSYGELATLAGSPNASRAAGTAMRKNPLPIVIPCHRVISADGTLGGYIGNGENNVSMKKWLLHHEGAL